MLSYLTLTNNRLGGKMVHRSRSKSMVPRPSASTDRTAIPPTMWEDLSGWAEHALIQVIAPHSSRCSPIDQDDFPRSFVDIILLVVWVVCVLVTVALPCSATVPRVRPRAD